MRYGVASFYESGMEGVFGNSIDFLLDKINIVQ